MADYTGKTSGKLTLVAYRRPGGKGVGAIWTAVCECGNTRDVIGRMVIAGRIRSCGDCKLPPTNIPKVTKDLSYRFRRSLSYMVAKYTRLGIRWGIDYQEYRKVLGKNCTLCREPMTVGRVGVAHVQPCTELTPGNISPVCRQCLPHMRGLSLGEYLDNCYTHLENAGIIQGNDV
jgi:hypothetical protein